MASTKLMTLAIRTIAKPISNRIKAQAKEHPTFRNYCVALAQRMHRTEVQLRTNILGEHPKAIRPLSEAKAIDSGANAIAEGFLFAVAAGLILGEAYRSSRSLARRRDVVNDRLDALTERIDGLQRAVQEGDERSRERWEEEARRNDELTRILTRVVEVGLRGGWAEFEDTPLRVPRISAILPPRRSESSPDASGAGSPGPSTPASFSSDASDSSS